MSDNLASRAERLWDEYCTATRQAFQERLVGEENRQINQAFVENLVAIENARHRR
jgi:hypothetical protein